MSSIRTSSSPSVNRWVLAIAALLMQIALGAVYAWSVFLKPLASLYYGGGFGTMPAFTADFFGPKNAGTIYGAMLTAWSAGGIVGPILIASIPYATALYIIAVIMLISCAIPLIVRELARRRGDVVEVTVGAGK